MQPSEDKENKDKGIATVLPDLNIEEGVQSIETIATSKNNNPEISIKSDEQKHSSVAESSMISKPEAPNQPNYASKVVKTKRKAHHKSRLGCQTCKRRRIKCDETRPICQKCQSLALECGYEIEARAKTKENPKDNTGLINSRVDVQNGLPNSLNQNNNIMTNNASSRPNPLINTALAELPLSAGLSHTLVGSGIGINGYTAANMNQSSLNPSLNMIASNNNMGNMIPGGVIGVLGDNTGSGVLAANSGLAALAANGGLAALAASGGLAALTANGGLAALTANGGLAALASGRGIPSFTQGGGLSALLSGEGLAALSGGEGLAALGGLASLASRMGVKPTLNTGENTDSATSSVLSSASVTHTSIPTATTEAISNPSNTETIALESTTEELTDSGTVPQQIRKGSPLPDASLNPSVSNVSSSHTLLPTSSNNNPSPLEDGLAMIDLRLLHHYTTVVWKTITDAGISDEEIWREDLPVLAFDNPFLMHALLCFSATHLSRTVKGVYDHAISFHRLQAMSMLREAVKSLKPENTDPLVASSLLLIMESLANASTHSAEAKSASAQAWIFHVRGAATILSAVWPLTPESRFYRLIGMDLRDLNNSNVQFEIFHKVSTTGLDIFDPDIADLYPVDLTSPYFPTLAYLDKLQSQQNFPDFILRVFSFPALMDKKMGELLCSADTTARRILGAYCKFVLKYTHQMKDKIWFLEGLASVPRADIEVFGSLGLVSLNLPQIGILDEMMPDYDFNTFDVMDYLV